MAAWEIEYHQMIGAHHFLNRRHEAVLRFVLERPRAKLADISAATRPKRPRSRAPRTAEGPETSRILDRQIASLTTRGYIRTLPLAEKGHLKVLYSQTEEEILTNLKAIMKDKTSIIISHRVSSVKNADNIIVLQHGKIVEQGSHQQLLEKQGTYAGLYKMQLLEEEKSLA
jgi:ABC-type thiamine transport system ATPase subunit